MAIELNLADRLGNGENSPFPAPGFMKAPNACLPGTPIVILEDQSSPGRHVGGPIEGAGTRMGRYKLPRSIGAGKLPVWSGEVNS
jgi:hypothetical protein